MGRKPNRYHQHVVGLMVKYNKSNEAVICRHCRDEHGFDYASTTSRMPKTKKMIKNHLKKCNDFAKHMEENNIVWEFSDGEYQSDDEDDQVLEASAARPRITQVKSKRTLQQLESSAKSYFVEHIREKRVRHELEQEKLDFERTKFNRLCEEMILDREQRERAHMEALAQQTELHQMQLDRMKLETDRLIQVVKELSKKK